MYELKISVCQVLGTCTSDPPMRPGDYITVCDGAIQIPEGGHICMWALQSILPVIAVKEQAIAEGRDDRPGRAHHAQCPDPEGRVIFDFECVPRLEHRLSPELHKRMEPLEGDRSSSGLADMADGLRDLRVVVEEVRGTCSAGLRQGDFFLLHGGSLSMPADRPFCLYALHAALPLLPAKQRVLADGDWLKQDSQVICPAPEGNVILRIEHR